MVGDDRIDVGSLADLDAAGVLVARGADRPLAIYRDGEVVRAIDRHQSWR